MKNFARKVALVFALCLVCVSFAAARKGKGSAARQIVGKVSVSRTASADSTTKTVDLLNGSTVSITPAFDVVKAKSFYIKFDCTNGDNGKSAYVSLNDKKLDGSFVFGEWWQIPAEKKNGMILIGADNYLVQIK